MKDTASPMTQVLALLTLTAFALCVLLVLWVWRLRRKLSKSEEKLKEYEKQMLGVAGQTHGK